MFTDNHEPMEIDDNGAGILACSGELRFRTTQVDTYICNYIAQVLPDIVTEFTQNQDVKLEKWKDAGKQIIFRFVPQDKSISEDKIKETEDQFDGICRQLMSEITLKLFPLNRIKFPDIDSITKAYKKERENQPVAFQIKESGENPLLEIIGKIREIGTVAEKLKQIGVINDCGMEYHDYDDKGGNLTFTTSRGIKVMIYEGDITQQKTTAIVNPTNEYLSNIGSVSRAIYKADYNDEMQRLCQMHIQVNGPVSIGGVVCTKAAAGLNCKGVIHAVGPTIHSFPGKTLLRDQLKSAILNSILCFDKELPINTEGSISIPAIGSGGSGIEISLVSKAFKEAIFEFDCESRLTSKVKVKEIHLVNNDKTTTDALKSYFRKEFETFKKKIGDNSDMRNGATNSPKQSAAGSDSKDDEDDDCCICMDTIKIPKVLPCKHKYCKDCIDQHEKISGPKCPQCFVPFGKIRGNQPPGTWTITNQRFPGLSGYESYGTITIKYSIPGGTQTERHPHPGQPFNGTSRTAYLPANAEGENIAELLKKAFDEGHIFTVGRSVTTGADNSVIWNDIHHKTVTSGSPYGYPDPQYLKRVREELRAKGIVSEEGDKKYAKK